MTRTEFGLFLDMATEDSTVGQHVAAYLPLIRLAEAVGFTSLWCGESYPGAVGGFQHVPSPLLVLAALSQHTSMTLGTAVALLPVWDPLRLAYDTTVLDQLTGGRFVLGVGLGAAPTWKQFGLDPATIASRTDESIQALRALWSGTPFSGRFFTIDKAIGPRPVRPGGPPILVGGKIARSARRAALLGDGFLAGTHFGLPQIARQIAVYRDARAGAGMDPAGGIVSVNRIVVLAATDEEAWADAAPAVERLLRRYAALNMFEGAAAFKTTVPGDQAALRAAVSDMAFIGSPETVAARLAEYVAMGVGQFQLRPSPTGMPAPIAQRTIELAGTRLLPRFL